MDRSTSTAASGHMSRPPRTYRTGSVTRWLRIASVILTAATVGLALLRYPALPETIAVHFDVTGAPDRWGPRSMFLINLPIFAAIVGGMTWLSFHPRIFNFPREVSEHNAQDLYRIGEQMVVGVTAGGALLFASIAAGTMFDIPITPLVIVGLAALTGSLAVGLIQMFRLP